MIVPSSNILTGSLIGDSLALGPHWIYDQAEIQKRFGRVVTYQAPMATYHAGKTAGDFTHYGDQAMVLLRSIAEQGRFDLSNFSAMWHAFWENPATISYRDGATRAVLANQDSSSHDIAGAARIGPLFLLEWENDQELFAAVELLTTFTHRSAEVVETAEFYTHVILAVQRGESIPNAVQKTMALTHWQALRKSWLDAALLSAESSMTDALALQSHGLACSTSDAFPAICHLLLRYPQDPEVALIENINAGGDSAARGMILGLVYGAKFSVSAWPSSWLGDLKAYPEILDLIQAITLHSEG
ncbi:MAG: ADP-ribosylglycohydrolase family protein [Akkermansiaceae bacterium]|nr:ADP-ribosylglycohydrolase family protein [Akkermansiaceae bacterium]